MKKLLFIILILCFTRIGWAQRPTNADQVLTQAWATANAAGNPNMLAVSFLPLTPPATNPTNADQVLTSVWNATNNGITIFLLNPLSPTSGGTGITSLVGFGGQCLAVKPDASGYNFVSCGGGGPTGTGTANTITKWTGASTLANASGLTTPATYILQDQASSSTGSIVFTGTGLNDMTKSGTYVGFQSCIYTVTVNTPGTPDTFNWNDGVCGDSETGVNMVASYTVSYGVTFNFGATTGHTAGDHWTFTASVVNPLNLLDAAGGKSVAVFFGGSPLLIYDPGSTGLFLGDGAGNGGKYEYLSGGSTGIGYLALAAETTGANNTALGATTNSSLTTGSSNTAIGNGSLYQNTTGSNNTAVGFAAGNNSITGSDNTLIGYQTQVTGAASSNATALGSGAVAAASNTIQLGNTSVVKVNTSGGYVGKTLVTPVATFTSTAGTAAINLSASNIQQHALTENTTCSLSNIVAGQSVTFLIIQNAGAAKTFTCGAAQHAVGFMTVSATLSSINIQTCTASNNGTDLYCTPGAVGLTGGTP